VATIVATLIVTVAAIVMLGIVAARAAPAPRQAAQTPDPAELWSSIEATGKIVVGTSADYPPFEYYDYDFQLTGFDIALMDAIGEQLGVEVVYKDIVFDGLANALLLGQVDAAIAALSITPERQAVMDFSNVYYVGEDAVLARGDSTLGPIEAVEEMAGQRLGVERGSVYETWLRDNLVEPGLIPAADLFSYLKAADGVRDLKEDRVDLVVMDLQPAQAVVNQDGVKLVGQGLNMQRLAIALPQGATSLKTQIDNALTELQNEGQLASLIKQYLDQEPPPPPPTPTPPPATPTPQPPPPCVDGMTWIQDLSYDDKNMAAPPVLNPGQGFEKGWQVRNSGTCTWDTAYRLVYANGNAPGAQMNGKPVAITRQVAPGQTYDLKVNLIAPKTPGTYQGFWNMVNGDGQSFGQRIWAGIRVPAPPAPTPLPPQPPVPGINFSVDRTQIQAGECVNFSWNVQNVQAVYFYAQGEKWQQHGVTGNETRQVCPPGTTTYELRVLMRDGSTEIRQIRIDVQGHSGGGAPVIYSFTATPHRIQLGDCVEIRWEVGGDLNRVTISRQNATLWDNAPANAKIEDCPNKGGEKRYHMRAHGPDGQARAEDYVQVDRHQPR
jgi:polar amino acid transport system substrate-binding protein